jgi:hypothetical protein
VSVPTKPLVKSCGHSPQKKQGKWLEALPAVEFAINSAINTATGISPFDLILGCQPTLFASPNSINDKDPPALSKWLAICEKAWATACDELCTSRLKQEVQHNKHITNCQALEPGMLALLNTADWQALHQAGSDKLKERYEGPYTILRVFNHGQNFKLDLPQHNQRHLTFHVSKVIQFINREDSLGEPQGDLQQK